MLILSFFTSTQPKFDDSIIKMKKFFTFIVMVIFLFFSSFIHAGDEYSGNWHMVGKISEKCDFIGNAELVVNYSIIKIKAEKWRWLNTNEFKKKLFKGKIRKNNIDILMQSRGLGYKHVLKGTINKNKIFLTFSSSHIDMNGKSGGCSFEFIKR